MRREHRNQTAPDGSPRPPGRRGDNPQANQLDNFRTRLKKSIKNPVPGESGQKSGVFRNIRSAAFDPKRAFPFAPATEGMPQKAAQGATGALRQERNLPDEARTRQIWRELLVLAWIR